MDFNSINDYIRCSFNQGVDKSSEGNPIIVEVYFARTNDLLNEYRGLTSYFCENDIIKATKFHSKEDSNTWLFCHTLLRLIISAKLGVDPSDVTIIYDGNNKPYIEGNSLYFNISHTRDSFAFAISDMVRIGLDLEKTNMYFDYVSIISDYFNPQEIQYILADLSNSREKFFLLWTRKEAILKALGIGIIDRLSEVEVFREINFLNREHFDNLVDDHLFCDHYIYSWKVFNHYLSIAIPCKACFNIFHMDVERVKSYLKNNI